MHSSYIAKCSEVRQDSRCCGRGRVSCVRSGALDHGSEYPGRWWVGIYLAKEDFDGEEDGEQQRACLGSVRRAVQIMWRLNVIGRLTTFSTALILSLAER